MANQINPLPAQMKQAAFNKSMTERNATEFTPGGRFNAAEGSPINAIGSQNSHFTDPIMALTERIGQLRALTQMGGVNADGQLRESAATQLKPLEELLRQYQQRMGSERGQSQGQMQPQQAGMASRGGYGQMFDPNQGQGQYQVTDPYRDVRNAAIKAAQAYLQKKNPHLFKSLEE